jgi:hypothetical protein
VLQETDFSLGTLVIQQKAEKSFENYTVSRKKSIGKIIPYHLENNRINILIGYAIFINNERDIRTLEVYDDFSTFGRLVHGLRLAIQPISGDPHNFYAELRQAFPRESFDRHETLHPTISEIDLDEGSGLSVFEELRRAGAQVGTKQELIGESGKRSSYLCTRFSKDNLWAPIIAYVATRVLPISRGYSGSSSITFEAKIQ